MWFTVKVLSWFNVLCLVVVVLKLKSISVLQSEEREMSLTVSYSVSRYSYVVLHTICTCIIYSWLKRGIYTVDGNSNL